MDRVGFQWIAGLLLTGQFVLLAVSAGLLLRTVLYKRPRWVHLQREEDEPRRAPERLLRLLGVNRLRPGYLVREALLAGCGFIYDPAWYMLARRTAAFAGAAFIGCEALLPGFLPAPPGRSVIWIAGGALMIIAAACDKPLLESLRRTRAERIMKEVLAVSNQLLYFAGASLHLHVKLTRCLPYTSVIRRDMQRLLGEWYHDPSEAIARFKRRVGTAEAAGFAETIEALRIREDEAFYMLLRERIADYKARIETGEESRRETASYVLFVLAGLPILYMFQIFIYPWVQEGQKLFQSLQS